MIEFFGWLGSSFLVICSLPQLFKTFRTKNVQGLSFLFLLFWFLGEIFSLMYILFDVSKRPLIFNYLTNTLICFLILIYYIRYRSK